MKGASKKFPNISEAHSERNRTEVFFTNSGLWTITFNAEKSLKYFQVTDEMLETIIEHGQKSKTTDNRDRFSIANNPLMTAQRPDLAEVAGFYADTNEEKRIIIHVGHQDPNYQTNRLISTNAGKRLTASHRHDIAKAQDIQKASCNRKIGRYGSEEEAKAAIMKLRAKKGDTGTLQPYFCDSCGYWPTGRNRYADITPGDTFVMETYDGEEVTAQIIKPIDKEGKFTLSISGQIRLPALSVLSYTEDERYQSGQLLDQPDTSEDTPAAIKIDSPENRESLNLLKALPAQLRERIIKDAKADYREVENQVAYLVDLGLQSYDRVKAHMHN
jgi:hypothetical protein